MDRSATESQKPEMKMKAAEERRKLGIGARHRQAKRHSKRDNPKPKLLIFMKLLEAPY